VSTTLYNHLWVVWVAVELGSPVLLLLCLWAGIAKKGRIGRSLLVLAAFAVALYLVGMFQTLLIAWRHNVPVSFGWFLIIAWLMLTLAVLVIAVLSIRRGWPLRRLTGVLGVTMPLPLMLPVGLLSASLLLTGRF
jgi:uncharacterized membrane-anchored protein